MNKILQIKMLIPALLAGILLGCSNDDIDTAPGEVHPVQIPARISAGTNDFAFDFFKNLQETETADANLFVSPLSLHMALGMLLNGAENETATEILKTLKMEGVSLSELNDAYKTLLNDMPVADSKVTLGLANSVWFRNNVQVETDFKNVLNQSFNADVTSLEFNNAALGKINQWASDKTNGKIKKVLDQLDPDAVLYLLNALYFKGDWAAKFDSKNTQDKAFHLQTGTDTNVKMMYNNDDYTAGSFDKYSAVKLPYGNGQFEMTIVLPKTGTVITDLLNSFTTAEWGKIQSSLGEQKVNVGLPRFKLDYSVMLNSTLTKMGINKVFTSAAEFGKISKSAATAVSFIKQDTYLGIDETGTEAAAVTTIGMVGSAGPTEPLQIICDRPFGIIISEKTSNTILFMGRIMNPDSK
ncbi:serpin family protein [Dyadobacter sp. CY356]|uniref:serpin family protein n=1 Tax=Dyadobacter sp. CY356 TaxID=2906442 RepID=UPI001F316A2B|nr:serpin family protein [Dyadobacter sp. CY356]MCF0059511.1 serpin family protein [Dyadobacter sp. CY356]